MTTFSSTVTFPLTDPARLIRRLCKHWAHKLTTKYDEQSGFVDFGDEKIAHLYANGDTITIKIKTPTESELETIQSVMERHVIRMIPEDEITEFQWASSK